MLLKSIKPNSCHRVQIIKYALRSSASNVTQPVQDIKFDSPTSAYGYKTTGELFRGWLVFKLCSYTSLVNHLSQVISCQ